MYLIRNIIRVAISNGISLISNLIIGLILPIYLSVGNYGEYRLFLFYASYIGILHFGFIDAMYLKYGGINKEEINKNLLKKEHTVFIYYQLIISLVLLTTAFLFDNYVFILFTLSIIPSNLGSFHKLFYQATGQFKKYSTINITYTIINLLFVLMLLLYGAQNSHIYILFSVLAYFVVFIIMEIDFYKYTKGINSKGTISILGYIKVGIFVLIGNIGILFISSIGRWIVQLFYGIEQFAYYSFAVTMMSMVLVIINAVGLTFYNYIAKNENEEVLVLVKELLLIIGVLSSAVYFFLEFVVISVVPKYEIALQVIKISFITFPYLMVINVIITNLYKARKQERKFFKVVLFILILGVLLNILAFIIFNSMNAIAFATLLSFIIWYIYSTNIDFNYLKVTMKELIYLTLHILIYLLCSNFLNWFVGLTIYLMVMSLLSIAIYNNSLIKLYNRIKRAH